MARISWDYSRTPHQIRISYEAAICSFETAGPFAFRTFLLSRCPFGEELFCRSVLHYLDAFAPSTPAMCFILWVDTRGTVSFFAFYFPNNPGLYFFRNTGGPKSVASAKSNYLDRRRTASDKPFSSYAGDRPITRVRRTVVVLRMHELETRSKSRKRMPKHVLDCKTARDLQRFPKARLTSTARTGKL